MLSKIRFSIWFSIIVLSAFLVGYLSWAKATFNWPFDDTFYPYPETNRNTPSPVQGEGEGEVDLAGWKTYRNEEYGFEFKHPERYVFCSISLPPKEYNSYNMLKWIGFEEVDNQRDCYFTFFMVQIYENDNRLAAEDWFENQKGKLYSQSLSIFNRLEISGADSQVIVFKSIGFEGSDGGDNYVIQKGDKIITLGHVPNENISRDFPQILSTFKFIE